MTDPARKQFASSCWQALLQIDPGAQEAIPAWRQLLRDDKQYAREEAALALSRLIGMTNGSGATVQNLPAPAESMEEKP